MVTKTEMEKPVDRTPTAEETKAKCSEEFDNLKDIVATAHYCYERGHSSATQFGLTKVEKSVRVIRALLGDSQGVEPQHDKACPI